MQHDTKHSKVLKVCIPIDTSFKPTGPFSITDLQFILFYIYIPSLLLCLENHLWSVLFCKTSYIFGYSVIIPNSQLQGFIYVSQIKDEQFVMRM